MFVSLCYVIVVFRFLGDDSSPGTCHNCEPVNDAAAFQLLLMVLTGWLACASLADAGTRSVPFLSRRLPRRGRDISCGP